MKYEETHKKTKKISAAEQILESKNNKNLFVQWWRNYFTWPFRGVGPYLSKNRLHPWTRDLFPIAYDFLFYLWVT